jgi:glycosyltransferase involved in cell wall biosynthesis
MGEHRPLLKRTATVCQVLHSLGVGGAEVLAARLARQLAGAFRFLFVCLDDLGTLGQELRAQGFPVWVLGRRPGVDWRCSWRLANLLRQQRVDVVHAHQYTPFFYALTARLLYRRPSILFMEHGRSFPDYPRPKRMVVNRLLLERRDRVVGVGQAVRQALIRNEGLPAKKVAVIYNGIDLSAFANGFHDPQAVRREMGVGDPDLVILQVARLDPLKDHATAIHTLEHVVRRCGDVRLVLVGEGPELGKVQQLIAERNLSANVRFLGLRKDVGRLLSAADLFLLTSVSEGIPLAVIEAMAAGLPVVATQVGGTGEVVLDGSTGLLAPSGDAAALAERILQIAENPALGKQMGQRGCERARDVFSESQMLARYVQLYQEMLTR